jgi:hypothetical protein
MLIYAKETIPEPAGKRRLDYHELGFVKRGDTEQESLKELTSIH